MRLLLAAILCVPLFWPPPVGTAPSTPDLTVGTYHEAIRTLQSQRILPVREGAVAVSIPYTRLDVLVENGVAFQRIVQTYHNHGTENQGFAFQVNLPEDGLVTAFTIWDRGRPYEGVIEDRQKAEAVYKKVTGDEAPTMNKDPGLVRTAAGRFEVRVFPIFPGETKQIELLFMHRLRMVDGRLTVPLALDALTLPADTRHGKVQSRSTDVSVLWKDEVNLTACEAGRLTSVHEVPKQKLFRLRAGGGMAALQVSCTLEAGDRPHVSHFTYNQGGRSYYLLRILGHRTTLAQPAADPQEFYMGVWRSTGEMVSEKAHGNELRHFTREVQAFRTLGFLNKKDTFIGGWQPVHTKAKGGPGFLHTSRAFSVQDAGPALQDALNRGRTAKKDEKDQPQNTVMLADHLAETLRAGRIRFVILFLGSLDEREWQRLLSLARAHPDRRFFLYSDPPPEGVKATALPNVSCYFPESGWQGSPAVSANPRGRLLEPNDGMIDFFRMLTGGRASDLVSFWSGLPNPDPGFPQLLATSKRMELLTVQRGLGGNLMMQRFGGASAKEPKPESLAMEWLSGELRGSGQVKLRLTARAGAETSAFLRKPGQALGPVQVLEAEASLGTGSAGARFAGAFAVQPRIAELELARAMAAQELQRLDRAKREHDRQAELASRIRALRDEQVDLSRRLHFITSETAFIALPEDMRKQYGIGADRYSPAGGSSPFQANGQAGGVPEPEEWLLLGVALAVLAGLGLAFAYRRLRVLYQTAS